MERDIWLSCLPKPTTSAVCSSLHQLLSSVRYLIMVWFCGTQLPHRFAGLLAHGYTNNLHSGATFAQLMLLHSLLAITFIDDLIHHTGDNLSPVMIQSRKTVAISCPPPRNSPKATTPCDSFWLPATVHNHHSRIPWTPLGSCARARTVCWGSPSGPLLRLTRDALLSILDSKEDNNLDSLSWTDNTLALLSQVSRMDDFQLVCFLTVW